MSSRLTNNQDVAVRLVKVVELGVLEPGESKVVIIENGSEIRLEKP